MIVHGVARLQTAHVRINLDLKRQTYMHPNILTRVKTQLLITSGAKNHINSYQDLINVIYVVLVDIVIILHILIFCVHYVSQSFTFENC